MRNLIYKLKLLILRILCYEKPLRVALFKYLSLKFSTFRPHYETLIFESAKNAIKLGYKEINVIELGVEVGFDTAITLIEWPDRMGNYLPLEHLKISLFQGDIEDSRYISFKGSSNWEQRIERLNV